jgi:hypothetical protein
LQDVAFIADTSNMLIVAAAELTSTVRWRVAWSLGNLGDALVLNRFESFVFVIDVLICFVMNTQLLTKLYTFFC